MEKKQEPIWSNGIRFECQQSGKCCTSRGEHGYVYLTDYDQKRLAKFFKITVKEFREKYCEHTDDPVYYLKNPEKDCAFIRGHKCTVYSARPTQCRTWPFWPEHMNARTWKKDVLSFCPGIGKGKLYSREEIEKILKKDLFFEEHAKDLKMTKRRKKS